jgi:phosphoribosyl 1,2-cyclic phosphate phosphodiesterase
MKIIFLGTGTSVGVPMIGCSCRVCCSSDPHNKRRRTSLYLEAIGQHLVVDTTPDFREQALQYRIPRLDAVLFTHSHADHIFGFDDVRRFNTIQNTIIPAYGSPATIADLKRVFDYVHNGEEVEGTYRPKVDFREISGPFDVGRIQVEPIPVEHGPKPMMGYRFRAEGKSLGYVPDCHQMPHDAIRRLQGVDVMVLDALRHKPHTTHLTVADSVNILQRIGAARSYVIHMCHDLDHEETQRGLPSGMYVSYDGLAIEM